MIGSKPGPGISRVIASTAAASALADVALPAVHARGTDTTQLALIGCGGRGTGAIGDALSVADGNLRLVAMADVFESRLGSSHKYLSESDPVRIDVPADRRFVGFDGYRLAMDCLNPGDIVLLTTPPAFRWPMFQYAIEKGLNVFMEKPVSVDGPSSRRMLALAEQADARNLKVAVGLMYRHCEARAECVRRVRDGAIGLPVTLRSYRQVGEGGLIGPRPEGMSELLYQIQNFHGFFWASGGVFMDYMIHNIDECCWLKGSWPVKAQGNGARCHRGDKVDQNFDHYSIEYSFDDGTRLFVYTRNIPGCRQEFASYVQGTAGSGVLSLVVTPARCRLQRGFDLQNPEEVIWQSAQPEPNPYQLEWRDFLAAIREDRPYNEVKRGVEASLVTAMGRMACHTGQEVGFEEMLNHPHEFAPEVDQLTSDSPAPLQMASGATIYPQPEPGLLRDREY